MNALYLYRQTKNSEETLKFSRRSLKYAGVDKVYLIGDETAVEGIDALQTGRHEDKYQDVNKNFRLALALLPSHVPTLLMHDDFFLTPLYKPVRYFTRKPFPTDGQRSHLLAPFGEHKNFALHFPMPFIPAGVPELPRQDVSIMQWLGVYHDGTFPAERFHDVKFDYVKPSFMYTYPAFSTYDERPKMFETLTKMYP